MYEYWGPKKTNKSHDLNSHIYIYIYIHIVFFASQKSSKKRYGCGSKPWRHGEHQ